MMFDKGKRVKGKIGVIGPYQHHISKGITPLEALYTALHEVGHGIERDYTPGKEPENDGGFRSTRSPMANLNTLITSTKAHHAPR